MSNRPFQLPQDIDLMNSLLMEDFHYPEIPAWSVQEDEVQGMVDRMKGAKHVFPEMQKASPGSRIEIDFVEWESALIE